MLLITKRSIKNSHNIAHEQKLRGMKYRENPYSENPDKPEQVHRLKVSALKLLIDRNQNYNVCSTCMGNARYELSEKSVEW